MTQAAGNARPGRVSWAAGIGLVLLGGLGVALTLLLWPHWRQNPDLSHGFFMPAVFLFLLYESRTGTQRFLGAGAAATAAQSVLLLLGVLALVASGLYAASLDWSHALVGFTLTVSFVFFLGAGLVVYAARSLRLVPVNWTSVAAAGLWILSAPIPPGSYARLTLNLQLLVTTNVLHALHVLGIAAARQGNVIDLATGSVGVEEACSGVRSLVSCVFAGVLFSATLVRRPWARVLLIGLSVPLALLMNFIRSLTLTLLANAGIQIAGTWHDVTGFAVLGVTAALLAGLALLLESQAKDAPARSPAAEVTAPNSRLPRLLVGGLAVAAALALFFYANTRPSIRRGVPVPDLMAILPAAADGWAVRTSNDLFQFTSTLQTDHLAQRTYSRLTPAGPQEVTVYLAYWRAGQAPVSLVASHTPDACWPGSGWEPAPGSGGRAQLSLAGRPLPDAEVRRFRDGASTQFLWFWHIYDGHPIDYRDPYSARELLSIAWRYGFQHDGDQLFVRVSSDQPWEVLGGERLIADIFGRLAPLGLRPP
jgi:exosortase